MSFYLRKSIRVGPIRFNLSKSGIGVSAGITGFRIGTGPRGNYVHMGRGGVYYRKTLSPSRGSRSQPQPGGEPNFAVSSQRGVGPMVEIESSGVAAMNDSSSAELLQELNEKKRKIRIGPWIVILAVLSTAASFFAALHPAIQAVMILGWIVAVYLAFRRDALTKTVVLFYAFDEVLERAYGALHEAAARLASCAGHWHIAASGKVYERKYHAGASSLVDRKPTPIRRTSPPFLKTNVETISIGVGRQTMFLFPDRVLVYESGKIGAIGYDQLQISVSQTQFIERPPAPGDAQVVGQTWQYVNKKGGPDRRFANNPVLPICLYDELYFSSASGLNEIIQVSRCGVGESFQNAVSALSSHLAEATTKAGEVHREPSYCIGRNGEDLGELPISKIKDMLARGELLLQDSYFDLDAKVWRPLYEVMKLWEKND